MQMENQRYVSSYQQFLAKHRVLETAVDAVLEHIGDYTRLNTAEQFQNVASDLNAATSKSTAGHFGFYRAIKSQFRPSKIDKLTILRLALVCRVVETVHNYTPWRHQIAAALLLRQGIIVELPNGSGKTLAAALAAGLNGISGLKTHVATANDYLAERDLRWMGPIFLALGLSCGVSFSQQNRNLEYGVLAEGGKRLRAFIKPQEQSIPSDTSLNEGADSLQSATEEPEVSELDSAGAENSESLYHITEEAYEFQPGLAQKEVLACDVVYGRLETFAFAYLNDYLVYYPDKQVIQRRDALIVDECDALLLDGLRTPVVVSRQISDDRLRVSRGILYRLHELANNLKPEVDFHLSGQTVHLTYDGLAHIEKYTGQDFFVEQSCGLAHGLIQALRAHYCYQRDRDYVVENDKVIVVEQHSGRLLENQRYSDGLQEAIEIKEGVSLGSMEATEEIARITAKHFALSYRLLSGMTGVAGPEEEYLRYYALKVIRIMPFADSRDDDSDMVYLTKSGARNGLCKTAISHAQQGRPVLINVPSLRDVDEIAQILATQAQDITVQVLDGRSARTLTQEATAVARAGQSGVITVCSRLAARGTDICIDDAAKNAGGLLVLGLERSIDRRYDDQLRGRAARHGDPGGAQFFLSLEDDLIHTYTSTSTAPIMRYLGIQEDEPIVHPWVNRSIQNAQRRIMNFNKMNRELAVESDDVLDRHRKVFYHIRQKFLEGQDSRKDMFTMVDNWVHYKDRTILNSLSASLSIKEAGQLLGALQEHFRPIEVQRIANIHSQQRQVRALKDTLRRKLEQKLESLRQVLGDDLAQYFCNDVTLMALDENWTHHLAFNKRTWKESILLYDLASGYSKYMEYMEETFDRFFYQVGEEILAIVLRVQTQNLDKREPSHV